MGIKLSDCADDGTISLEDLQEGLIAVVVRWPGDSAYEGHIVQRVEDFLVHLGNKVHWTYSLLESCETETVRVRVLERGETLDIY